MPDQPYQSPATVPPVAAPPAAAYVPPQPPPAAARKSSSAWVVIAIALALVLGGGAAAAIVGYRMYNNWKSGQAGPQTASTDTAAPATNSAAAVTPSTSSSSAPPGVLLSQQASVPQTNAATTPSTMPSNVTTPTMPATSHNTTPVQVAQNTPIRTTQTDTPARIQQRDEPRPARRLSGVAVAVTGDPNLTSAVSDVLESELRSAGVRFANAESLPGTEGMVRNGEAAASRLLSRLRDDGYAVLLLARVDAAGQRELKYLGRYDTAYTSKVTLTTYDLASGRPFGSPARGTIEYTSVNQDKKTEEVVGRIARETVEAIQNH